MSKTTHVYWASAHALDAIYTYEHLYKPMVSLYEEMLEKKANLKANKSDFLRCPAVNKKMKKIFVMRSSTNTNIRINEDNEISYELASADDGDRHQTLVELLHEPTIENRILVNYMHPIIFFTDDESLTVSITPPYFHKTIHSDYGVIVPGEFDVANWFRPMNFEFQLWDGVRELRIPANEPLGYFEFHSENKIELHRFKMTENLTKIWGSLIRVSPHRRFTKLSEKYLMFKQSKLSSIIMKEIQQNLF